MMIWQPELFPRARDGAVDSAPVPDPIEENRKDTAGGAGDVLRQRAAQELA